MRLARSRRLPESAEEAPQQRAVSWPHHRAGLRVELPPHVATRPRARLDRATPPPDGLAVGCLLRHARTAAISGPWRRPEQSHASVFGHLPHPMRVRPPSASTDEVVEERFESGREHEPQMPPLRRPHDIPVRHVPRSKYECPLRSLKSLVADSHLITSFEHVERLVFPRMDVWRGSRSLRYRNLQKGRKSRPSLPPRPSTCRPGRRTGRPPLLGFAARTVSSPSLPAPL
jgi:hypothetical protein